MYMFWTITENTEIYISRNIYIEVCDKARKTKIISTAVIFYVWLYSILLIYSTAEPGSMEYC